MCKISVIMSVFNGQRYLKDAIDSIINQTFDDYEFIIINDGSTDNSLEIIKSYSDSRIKLINNLKNIGLIRSLNKGIDHAKGKYIARMDADDISLKNRFKIQYDFLEKNKRYGVCGSYVRFFGKCRQRTYKVESNPEIIKADLLFKTGIPHTSVMIRRKIIEKHNLRYNLKYTHAEDMEFWQRCIQNTKITNIKKVLLKYRIHENNITKFANGKFERREKIYRNIHKEYLKMFQLYPSEKEIKLHRALCNNEEIVQKNILFDIIDWLKKMETQNNKLCIIEKNSFNYVLNKKLFFIFLKTDVINIKNKFYILKNLFNTSMKKGICKNYIKLIIKNLKDRGYIKR